MSSDFAVTLHACLLIGMPIATLVAVLVLRRRIPARRGLLLATVLAGAVTFFAAGATRHLCDAGDPYYQWIIGGPCLFLVLAFIHGKYWRRSLGVVLAVITLGLSCHFTEVVHEPGWWGNPRSDGHAGLRLKAAQDAVLVYAKEHQQGSVEYPAGWLRDLPIWPDIAATIGDRPSFRAVLQPLWHTWLTGLYRVERIPHDYWYPGGRLDEAAARIEFRDRPQDR